MENKFRMVLNRHILLLLVAICLTSCVLSVDEVRDSNRTVLVYIGRDNSLRSSSEEKIESLMKGWDGSNGHLIIYQDLYDSGSVLEEIYVDNGVKKTRLLDSHLEDNSASAAVFERVLRQVVSEYPADSYGLVLFSHASGWLPDATLTSPRSLETRALVQDNANWMSLRDFASVIPDGQFDFIVFEACFMSGIEVAYELRNKTNFILASSAEILSPGFKSIYETSTNELFRTPAGLETFARRAFEEVDAKQGELRSATFSLIKTAGLYELSYWLGASIDTSVVVNLRDVQHFDRYSYHLFFDFEDYFSRLLGSDADVAELQRLIANCVVYHAATPDFMPSSLGFEVKKHSGLTTYVRQSGFPYLNERYRELEWFKNVF